MEFKKRSGLNKMNQSKTNKVMSELIVIFTTTAILYFLGAVIVYF